MVNKYWASLRRLNYALLPGTCLLCRQATGRMRDICVPCEQDLPWLANHCRQCSIPLPYSNLCGQCLASPPAFDHCVAALEYRFPANHLITGFKHGKKLEFGNLLAELWLETCRPASNVAPDIIIPVPLHWRRQFIRGFNQAELLANYFSQKMQIECRSIIKRHRATAMQQGLSAAARRKNLKNAFSLPAALASQTIEGRHVVLVDDVVTTGSTAHQIALQCKRAGASRVDIWCIARTP